MTSGERAKRRRVGPFLVVFLLALSYWAVWVASRGLERESSAPFLHAVVRQSSLVQGGWWTVLETETGTRLFLVEERALEPGSSVYVRFLEGQWRRVSRPR